jgi:predicted amidohydrolase
MKCKIAVVQFDIKRLDPEYNLKKAERFIKKAKDSDAQIIVFPEDFITDPIVGKKEFADSENKYRNHFQNLAKKYNIDIVPGSIIEKDKFGLSNVSYYIDATGEVKSKYKKINLWHPERNYINPGHELSIFNTKYGIVGLIICWDLVFPEIFRKMAKKGVNIVICPSYWCYGDAGKIGNSYDKNSEIKLVDSLCISRAFENELIFVYCNAAGKLDLGKYSDTLIGHSQITVPFKGVISKLDHNKEDMIIQEIDTDIVKDAEKVYKIREDLRKKLL